MECSETSVGPQGKENEKVLCTYTDRNALTPCETLCWSFGTKRTFARFQAGFQHQLDASTVLTLRTHRENTAGYELAGDLLEKDLH